MGFSEEEDNGLCGWLFKSGRYENEGLKEVLQGYKERFYDDATIIVARADRVSTEASMQCKELCKTSTEKPNKKGDESQVELQGEKSPRTMPTNNDADGLSSNDSAVIVLNESVSYLVEKPEHLGSHAILLRRKRRGLKRTSIRRQKRW
jgi:hypothetical protein